MIPSVTLTLLELLGIIAVVLGALIIWVLRRSSSDEDLKAHLDMRLDAIDQKLDIAARLLRLEKTSGRPTEQKE